MPAFFVTVMREEITRRAQLHNLSEWMCINPSSLELFTRPRVISRRLGNVVKHMDCVVDNTVSATVTELKG